MDLFASSGGDRRFYNELHPLDIIRANILSKQEAHVSAAIQALTNGLLAPGLHVRSVQLWKKLKIGRKKRRVEASAERKKRKHESVSDSESDMDTSESVTKKGPKKKTDATKYAEKLIKRMIAEGEGQSPSSLSPEDRAVLAGFEYALKEFARQTLTNLIVYGFSPWCVARHATFGTLPTTFDLEDIRVRFRIQKKLSYDMLYYSVKPTMLEIVGMREVQIPTAGTWVLDGPSPDGHLRSLVAGLAEYAAQCAELIRAAAAAEMHISYPTVVLTSPNGVGGSELKEVETRKSNSMLPPETEAAMAYDLSVVELKRAKEAEEAERARQRPQAVSPHEVLASHTRMTPRSTDALPWLYTLQDATCANGSVTAPALKSTLLSVADYHHMMSVLVLQRFGLPHQDSTKSSGGGLFKSGGDSSPSAASGSATAKDPQMLVTLNHWAMHLSRFLEYLLHALCDIDDAEVVFPSLVDVSTAIQMLEADSLLPTPELCEQLAEATHLPATAFVNPSTAQKLAEMMGKEQENEMEERKIEMQMELEKMKMKMEEKKLAMEMEFKKQELEIKLQESQMKLKLDEQKCKLDLKLAKEKTDADIANSKFKTQVDAHNSTIMANTKARATAAVADARVDATKKKGKESKQ